MLYISRHIGPGLYGVVDTDDMWEQSTPHSELEDVVLRLGVPVEGVSIGTKMNGTRHISSIRPYQLPNKSTPLQQKTRMVKHTGVVVHDRFIANIHCDSGRIKSPVVINLQDFGTICSNYFLAGNRWVGRHVATLVVTDNILFERCALDLDNGDPGHSLGVDAAGFVFDLRAVDDDDKAEFVYQKLFWRNSIEAVRSILDKEERFDRMRNYYLNV